MSKEKPSKDDGKKSATYKDKPGYKLIFRRFRTLPSGAVLDAGRYGLKAWPIWVKDED